MITQIRANRLEISDRFPLLSFTVNSSGAPRVAEIVLATDIALFRDKTKRTSTNFFSSRELGLLSLPTGPAVYTVPPQILSRFAHADRLWFGLATADAATGSNWTVDLIPNESSPYISLSGLTDKAMGRVRMFPSRSRTVSRPGAQPTAARMEWAGDASHPGTSPAMAPNGSPPEPAGVAPAANGAANRANGNGPANDAPYDDGFGPLPPADQEAASSPPPANGAAERPGLVSAEALAVAQNYTVSDQKIPVTAPQARALTTLERAALEVFIAAAAGPFFPTLTAARLAARPLGLSIAVGIAGGGGLEVGASIGGGIIFAPNGDIGFYGLTEADFGLIFSASATVQFTILHGGISAFNGIANVATVSGGEGIVGGLTAIFDASLNFIGITIEAGVGIGEPVSVYVGIQNSVSGTLALSQSLASAIDPEEMGIEGPAMVVEPTATASALALAGKEYDRVSRVLPSPAFTTGRRGTAIDRIIIHITDAPSTSSTVNHFTRADANSSSHYLVGQDGEIVQFVSESDTAWHARGSNSRSIGIEHVAVKQGGATYGKTHFPELHPSDIQYSESSALVVHLCDKYGLTPDRTTIIGHREADANTSHTSCPDGAWDWDHFMYLVTNRISAPRPVPATGGAQALGGEIPLDPGVGGMSIGMDALEIGDIILSTTDQIPSRLIRFGSGAEVSHAMLFVGQGGQVIESVDEESARGVVLRPLSAALADSSLAVAFRVPGLSDAQKQQIADAAAQHIGRPFNHLGLIRNGSFQIDSATCALLPGQDRERCRNFVGRLELGPGTNEQFFCSQLVMQAFEDAGHRLTTEPAHWNAPGDIARLRLIDGALAYVGHLKAPIPQRSFFGVSLGVNGGASTRAMFNESFTINWDDVDMIGQPTNLSCWATAGALVVGWGRQQSVTPDSIAELAGSSVNMGLNPADVGMFKDAIGLTAEAPQSYTQEGFRNLVETKGPLWVAADVPGLHAIVVTGLYNDGEQMYVRISDPWDRTVGQPGAPGNYLPTHMTGSRYILKWEDFVAEYEKAATDHATVNLQILHNNGVNGRTPNRGERTPLGYMQAAANGQPADRPAADAQPMPTARGDVVADNPFGPSTVLSRQRIEKNGRSYDLAQLKGMVQPASPMLNGDAAAVPGERVMLDDWPYIDGPTGKTQAGIAIDWAHSAGKVGDVAITPLDGQTLDGWSVAVKADLLPNGTGADIAHVKVRVTTTFNKEGEEAQIAVSEVTLGGDGRHQIRHGADQAPLDVPPEVPVRQEPQTAMPTEPASGNGNGAMNGSGNGSGNGNAAPQPALELA